MKFIWEQADFNHFLLESERDGDADTEYHLKEEPGEDHVLDKGMTPMVEVQPQRQGSKQLGPITSQQVWLRPGNTWLLRWLLYPSFSVLTSEIHRRLSKMQMLPTVSA